MEVEVQGGVGAAAERLLHLRAVGVGGPVVADHIRGAFDVESNVCGAVGLVENGGLMVKEGGCVS